MGRQKIADLERLFKLRDKGYSKAKLAETLGISYPTVCKYLKDSRNQHVLVADPEKVKWHLDQIHWKIKRIDDRLDLMWKMLREVHEALCPANKER